MVDRNTWWIEIESLVQGLYKKLITIYYDSYVLADRTISNNTEIKLNNFAGIPYCLERSNV